MRASSSASRFVTLMVRLLIAILISLSAALYASSRAERSAFVVASASLRSSALSVRLERSAAFCAIAAEFTAISLSFASILSFASARSFVSSSMRTLRASILA